MGYDDDNDKYISIVNLAITILILGILLYLFISYRELKTKAALLANDYKKKFPAVK